MLNQSKSSKSGEKLTNRATEEMMSFKRGLMNWGSEELIQKFLEYDNGLIKQKDGVFTTLKLGNTFLKDMRRELGFEDSDSLNIMSVILNAEARAELKGKF